MTGKTIPSILSCSLLGLPSLAPAEVTPAQRAYHRVLWNGTVLSSEQWDRVQELGFTLVHSYGSHPATFLRMLDEAHQRGIKMIGGANYPRGFPWLEIDVDSSLAGAPSDLWPHVVHHFSQSSPSLILYGQGIPGLDSGIAIPLDSPESDTIDDLASYLNGLHPSISATAMPDTGGKPSTHLATNWYGNAVGETITLPGGELAASEAQFRFYVDDVKDHPALHCTDLQAVSPTFPQIARASLTTR